MAPGSDNSERDARIRLVDAQTPSPEARALRVWNVLQTHDPDLTTWDILCFCAEFMGMTSQRYQWIIPLSKHFAKLVYSAHYYDEARTDANSDRITRPAQPVDSGDRSNASPKSLFDLHRDNASSDASGGRNTSPESPLHLRDSTSPTREKSSPPNAGEGISGDASRPA